MPKPNQTEQQEQNLPSHFDRNGGIPFGRGHNRWDAKRWKVNTIPRQRQFQHARRIRLNGQ
jgi:hypothetical protein